MIAVVDYHKGNLKSVERGLLTVGGDAYITDNAEQIAAADAIVLPGVGAFADAVATMEELDQLRVIREKIQQGTPFLGICLGMHLMFETGEEGAGQAEGTSEVLYPKGLGILPGMVCKLPKFDSTGASYKIPHVGWNTVEYKRDSPLFAGIPDNEYFYFTHGYISPNGKATIGETTHSVTFPSVVQFGDAAFGVQFHPEKSSDAGSVLLQNFVDIVKGA